MARLKRRIRGKIATNLRYGFTLEEARDLASLKYSNRPYIRLMQSHRQRLVRDKDRGEALALIRQEYLDNDWRNVFSMMRTYWRAWLKRGNVSPEGEGVSYTKEYKAAHHGTQTPAQRARQKERAKTRGLTGRVARYDKLDNEGKPTGEKIRFNYDTKEFEDV